MIKLKKKICKSCGREEYIFSQGRCKKCDAKVNPDKYRIKVKVKTDGKPKRKALSKKRIKPISDKEKERRKLYKKARAEYKDVVKVCERCGTDKGLELHHKKGREGALLWDKNYFCLLCSDCHRHVHANPEESYKEGWLLSRVGKFKV